MPAITKKTTRWITLIIYSALIFLFSPPSISAVGQNLRVMTFNIGYTSNNAEGLNLARCGDHRNQQVQDSKNRSVQIANYLKNRGIEVALFQEFANRCGVFEEWVGLDEALDEIEYPMGYAVSSPARPAEPGYGLYTTIFSRFPIDQATVHSYGLTAYSSGEQRWYVVAPVVTDAGRITFYNLHTRNTVACHGLLDVFNRGIVDGNKQRIIGGDFNVQITKYPNNWHTRFEYCQVGRAAQQLKNYVDQFTVQPSVGIDFLLLPKDQPFSFTSVNIDEKSGIRSDHNPVIADIALNLPGTAVPKPAGDTDHDGDVDIFDLNKLLQNLGRMNCSVSVSGDCSIDVQDYNTVVAGF